MLVYLAHSKAIPLKIKKKNKMWRSFLKKPHEDKPSQTA